MQSANIALVFILFSILATDTGLSSLRQSPLTQSKQNPPATPKPSPTSKPQTSPTLTVKQEPFFAKVLRVLGITVVPSNTKSDEEGFDGDICLTELPQGQTRCITQSGSFRSPVLLSEKEQKILAVKDNKVVLLAITGQVEKAFSNFTVSKLVAINQENTSQVLLIYIDHNGQEAAGLLSWQTGQLTSISSSTGSEDDRKMMSHLRGWERLYGSSGEIRVYSEVRTSRQFGWRWREVLYQNSKGKTEVTQCKPNRCGQPSLSEDSKFVVYIKAKS